jgi:hypothetical protein
MSKNGGSTVRHVLSRNYPLEVFLNAKISSRAFAKSVAGGGPVAVHSPNEDVVQLVGELSSSQRRLRCVAANLPYGVHRFLERPVAYFTFVREPVSRCLSDWFMRHAGVHDGGERVWEIFERYDFDIGRMLAAGEAYHLSNEQIRMISGSSRLEIGREEFLLARELIEERYLFVGTTESMDRGLRLLGKRLGWDNLAYRRQNVAKEKDRSVLPPNAETTFKDANEWDSKLHDWLEKEYLPRREQRLSASRRPAP